VASGIGVELNNLINSSLRKTLLRRESISSLKLLKVACLNDNFVKSV